MALKESPNRVSQPSVSKPPEIAELLAKVQVLLDERQPAKAIELITRSRLISPWVQNAIGVCRMRLGQTQSAVDLFRGMVVSETLNLRDDVPAVCKTNYATALLVNKNLPGCQNVLRELGEAHPTAHKLKAAIERWKNGMGLWQKIQWYTGTEMTDAVPLDFPAGDLE